MNQTWENGKKTNIETNFGTRSNFFFSWVLPLLDVRHCGKLSLYAISKKTNDPNSVISPPPPPQKKMVSSVTKYHGHGQLSSCTISEKTNNPILRKCSDGSTSGKIDD